ncbi:brain-enriched guanylate kinase-associated protein isoform X2 [Ornithorhynchus anatinus]|uniref:brain-enriched guanylate kinase-associated protein isoform X2 n=1 Tax=Ornithorhynchus anatinus TaxID=9258 RepID=UPI0019D4BBFB|nr:brain-enriched guanylate kinase-associated protein isoform X2 [Ornithorhynchus anatinus]
MEKIRVRNSWVPARLWQPRILQGRLAKSSPTLWDSLPEQKGELRKRLSYTTHKLEMLESEFDSTRHYLEIELRRAQEELEKVTEKLRRIQNNYLTLQRINQDLEEKLYRMGQHYEEEKRALSHEIIALNNHLIEAKVTIDKLSEDNELYRKDCNLAVQLLQGSKTYSRAHKLSELPTDFQERVSLHLEKHGCSLSAPMCHPSFADNIPTCVIAKVLEKPDPESLSSHLSSAASTREPACRGSAERLGPGPQFKADVYCSDTALYCPEERRRWQRERRPSADTPGREAGFPRSQNSTDSTAEEDGFHSSFSPEAFPAYVASLPTSSSYSSFSVTSEEKEAAQASTLTASQQAIYLASRDEIFERQAASAYEPQGSPRFSTAVAVELGEPAPDGDGPPAFGRTASPYPGEAFRFPSLGPPPPSPPPPPPQAPATQPLRPESRNTLLPREEPPSCWRPLSVEDAGAYPYPGPGRLSPCSFSEPYYGPSEAGEGRGGPGFAGYGADSFSDGEDLPHGHLLDSRFLRAGGDPACTSRGSPDRLSAYLPPDPRAPNGERLSARLGGGSPGPEDGSGPKRDYVDGSRSSSADSLRASSAEVSPEMRLSPRVQSPRPSSSSQRQQQQFQRAGSAGLSRKDSLTKAQLYGTLLN